MASKGSRKQGRSAAEWFAGVSFAGRAVRPRDERVTEKLATLELPPTAYRPLPHEEQGTDEAGKAALYDGIVIPSGYTVNGKPGVFSDDFSSEEPTAPGVCSICEVWGQGACKLHRGRAA